MPPDNSLLLSLQALRDHCDRCEGRHTTTFHAPREVAANAIGRGETVEVAAAASGMATSIVSYWAQADTEFRGQIERARARHVRRTVKGVRE